MDVPKEKMTLDGYQAKSRNIIQMVDRLRDEGAQLEIDLPTVVFCGNQSAGKSSLIEAISSINLPRSDGTCTRCPMELRLSDTPEKWECLISLQMKYDNDGNPREVIENLPFAQNITSMDQVEIQVRRAQKAILNPSFSCEAYRYYEFDDSSMEKRTQDVDDNELKFTMNTVCLKISGSNINLTLVDLPGIIRSTETTQDAVFIKMVEDMVKMYIKNPRALIIATISCKDEIENQAIIALAKENDPNGIRTIGVLTKPDTIEPNCHETWLQVLNNSRFQLRLGYYIIKNPSKKDLDEKISFKYARKDEVQFFLASSPWSHCSNTTKSRMGVNNLRSALSLHLTELIEASLPSMRSKVYELIDQISKSLNALPEPVTQNPKLEIMSRIKNFGANIKELIEARGLEKNFYHSIDNHFVQLTNELYDTRPILVLPPDHIVNNSSSDVNQFIIYGEKSLRSHFTPDALKDIIDKQRGREFSQFIKSEALQIVMRICQKEWEECSNSCLGKVEGELKMLLVKLIDVHFKRFKKLSNKVGDLIETLVQDSYQRTRQELLRLCSRELDFPVTSDTKKLDATINSIHTQTEVPLNHSKLEQYNNSDETSIQTCLSHLSSVGINAKKEDLPKLIDNLFNERIRKLSEISQAYYQIAASRYGDLVPMTIYNSLIQETTSSVEMYLIESLQLFGDDKEVAANLLEESPLITAQREDYIKRLKRLREIRHTLA